MEPAESAVETLFLDHREPLTRILHAMVGCRQTAEDLVQEAYARLIRVGHSEPVTYPQPFLYQTARNLALDHLRREKVRMRTDCTGADPEIVEQTPSRTPSPEEEVLAAEQVELFAQALEALPQRKRQVLVLHRLHHWTYEQIGRHLGLSRRAVEKNVQTALSQVLAHMARHGG